VISSASGNSYLDEISLWSGVLDGLDVNTVYLNKKTLFQPENK
jgi:hypothetical protein